MVAALTVILEAVPTFMTVSPPEYICLNVMDGETNTPVSRCRNRLESFRFARDNRTEIALYDSLCVRISSS